MSVCAWSAARARLPQLGENTVLPTTMLTDLRHLENRREDADVLEVLATSLRHRQACAAVPGL